jgi:CCR4-NOT transcription complex subunit 7/8
MALPVIVREVWQHNLEEEVHAIMRALPHHRFVAMDTEFPGHVFASQQLSPYQLMKVNVDATNIIQLGIALCDANGESSRFWEFNFRDFDDRIASRNTESIELLKRQGIDFNKNRLMGIDSLDFARLILKCGLLRNSRITWVTFHGGYDFGYFIRILIRRRELPRDLSVFMNLLKYFFGVNVFDVKQMIKSCDGLFGGLERVAKALGVHRAAGKSHQAGSDSLLTLQTFMKLKDVYFNGRLLNKFECVIHGLTETYNNGGGGGHGYLLNGMEPRKDGYYSLNNGLQSIQIQSCTY